jgi:hypothetical protein
VPQGSLPNASRGRSTVHIAILTIVAIHAVFFAGLLMQGCKRDDTKPPPGQRPPISAVRWRIWPNSIPITISRFLSPFPPLSRQHRGERLHWLPSDSSIDYDCHAASGLGASARGDSVETRNFHCQKRYARENCESTPPHRRDITRANPGINPKRLIPGKKIQLPPPVPGEPRGLGFAEPSKPELGGVPKPEFTRSRKARP